MTVNTAENRKRKGRARAAKAQERTPYVSVGETQTIEEKKRILDELGKPELIDLFKDYVPQIDKRKRRTSPPLDQRVALSVTDLEKELIEEEIKRVRKSGDSSNVSQFVRGRATSSVDLVGWREKAEKLLDTIDDAHKNEKSLKRRRTELYKKLEDLNEDPEMDSEDRYIFEKEIAEITKKLESLTVDAKRRSARLSGRMTTPESEIIKWRANKLHLSVSDYLRFCLFGHEPGSEGDAHLSVDAKKRFYVGILEVSENGWGEPPTINQCRQCSHYREEAEKYKQRVRQLEQFGYGEARR